MGINYQKIESNSVGYKEDYTMYSLDFEEFLWTKGYTDTQIQGLYNPLVTLELLSSLEMNALLSLFQKFMILGGMPAVVWRFIQQTLSPSPKPLYLQSGFSPVPATGFPF